MGRRKGKKGKAARNASANQSAEAKEESYSKAPHSFVFHRGPVGKSVKELVRDVRKIMEPFTASSLKVKRNNVMKDFLTIAGPLHVSHFIVFSKTEIAVYMKLICVPRGPTLTFKVKEFSLAKDVLSFQKHPDVESKVFINHAVMVTNLPSDTMENKLMNVSFKNMFPSINPNSVSLNNMRRCVLVHYDPESKSIDMRHYTMKVVPAGVSRAVKKLMRPKLPNLGHHTDIADIFLGRGLSDSEAEQDGPHNEVNVPQNVKDRGVVKNAVNAIRLKEIGPRLSLVLIKIEEGFETGNVLYHSLVRKTPEEIQTLREARAKKQKIKQARKQHQDANVKKKKEAKEEHIKKSLEGMKKKLADNEDGEAGESPSLKDETELNKSEEEDDDTEYFRQEVGEEPEPEMFSQSKKRKRDSSAEPVTKRKREQSGQQDSRRQHSGQRDGRRQSGGQRDGRHQSSGQRDGRRQSSGQRGGRRQSSGQRDSRRQISGQRDGRQDNNNNISETKKKKFSVKFSQKQQRGDKKFNGSQNQKKGDKKFSKSGVGFRKFSKVKHGSKMDKRRK